MAARVPTMKTGGLRYDDRRASSASRGYGSRWQKARATFLAHHPLCRMCDEQGRVTVATVVDHIKPHRGDQALFWDRGNWQPLCKPHHDGEKQMEERRGYRPGVTVEGRPVDPGHPWNNIPMKGVGASKVQGS